MTPWYMGPISKHDTPCTGGADDYLKLLLDEIMPEAEALLPGAARLRGLGRLRRWLGCSPLRSLPNGCVCPRSEYVRFLLV